MQERSFQTDDRIGLGGAIVLHAGLVGLLLVQFQTAKPLSFGGDGAITVTLEDGLDKAGGSTLLGNPDALDTLEEPTVDPEALKEEIRPEEMEQPERSNPVPQPTSRPQTRVSQSSRGSENGQRDGSGDTGFDDAFGKGEGTGSAEAVLADIKISIAGQVAPKWNRCRVTGLDIEKLVAVVSFSMDRNGTITNIGKPRLSGQTPSNAAQGGRFEECAVRSLRLVKKFEGLPPEHYALWRTREFRFVKK